jgi:hypothetical protein
MIEILALNMASPTHRGSSIARTVASARFSGSPKRPICHAARLHSIFARQPQSSYSACQHNGAPPGATSNRQLSKIIISESSAEATRPVRTDRSAPARRRSSAVCDDTHSHADARTISVHTKSTTDLRSTDCLRRASAPGGPKAEPERGGSTSCAGIPSRRLRGKLATRRNTHFASCPAAGSPLYDHLHPLPTRNNRSRPAPARTVGKCPP